MSELLKRLLAFLNLGVDGEADPDPPEEDDGSLETLLEAGEEGTPPAGDEDADEPLKKAQRESREAKEQLEQERQARIAAENRAAPPVQTTPARDPDFEREERELAELRAAGATPEALGWKQWQVDTNRKMRASERNSQSALYHAQDIADKAEFDRIETKLPKTYRKYAPKVEEQIAKIRSNGGVIQPGTRTLMLKAMIGDDALKNADKPKPRQREAAPAQQVDRGRSPTTRSDTRGGKGAMTEHEKRVARLRDQRI